MTDSADCAIDCPYLVPYDGSFNVARSLTRPPADGLDKPARQRQLEQHVAELAELQKRLYADDRYSLLLIFQAMDAAGKDSTIRSVLTGVNPAGCEVYAFKRPSEEELDHDFLWRTSRLAPRRGHIGVFNRSHYEEVLVVKVQPELLAAQKLPRRLSARKLFEERYESIRDHERHLARSGTVVIKFWLNVSQEEQRERLLARLDEPEKNWKFEGGDLSARGRWKDYMKAYEAALNETSRPWAPWYAIPADSKSQMRVIVADIVVRTLKSLKLEYPTLSAVEKAQFDEMRKRLQK